MQKTSFPFEIIIGEDGSTDGTREICIEYAEKYSNKIRLFLRDRKLSILSNEDGSIKTSFNDIWGRMSSKGKYIAWCDGDDYWLDPYKLQKQVTFLDENKEYALCFHDSKVVNKDNEVISKSRLGSEYYDFSKNFMVGGPFLIASTAVFRNIVKVYPEFYFTVKNHDTALWHLLGFHGAGKFIPNIDNSAYRVHDGSLWSSISITEKIKNLIILRKMIKNNLVGHFGNSHIAVKVTKKRLRILRRKYYYQYIKKTPFIGNIIKSIYQLLKTIIK